MQFSLMMFFAFALALSATVLPAFAKPISYVYFHFTMCLRLTLRRSMLNFPIGSRPRIGTIINPPNLGNAPIAMNIPGVPSRRDDLSLYVPSDS